MGKYRIDGVDEIAQQFRQIINARAMTWMQAQYLLGRLSRRLIDEVAPDVPLQIAERESIAAYLTGSADEHALNMKKRNALTDHAAR